MKTLTLTHNAILFGYKNAFHWLPRKCMRSLSDELAEKTTQLPFPHNNWTWVLFSSLMATSQNRTQVAIVSRAYSVSPPTPSVGKTCPLFSVEQCCGCQAPIVANNLQCIGIYASVCFCLQFCMVPPTHSHYMSHSSWHWVWECDSVQQQCGLSGALCVQCRL